MVLYSRKVKDVSCPECGSAIIYNGTYYCVDEEGCNWGIGDPPYDDYEQHIVKKYLLQRKREAILQRDTDEVVRMNFYLADL